MLAKFGPHFFVERQYLSESKSGLIKIDNKRADFTMISVALPNTEVSKPLGIGRKRKANDSNP